MRPEVRHFPYLALLCIIFHMNTKSMNYESISTIVRSWPVSSRLTLVQDVLQSIEAEIEEKPTPKKTLHLALGLLKTDAPPPTDEEVAQWLDEHRIEKYGS